MGKEQHLLSALGWRWTVLHKQTKMELFEKSIYKVYIRVINLEELLATRTSTGCPSQTF